MAIKTYNDQNFVAIANAIRAKNGETTQYKPSEMAPAIMAIESGLELLPQDTAAGAIANFPDGSNNYPVVELIANIEPKQAGSGDPSPSNVRPISGSTECNITRIGKNFSKATLDQGQYGSNGGYSVSANRICIRKEQAFKLPKGQYTLSLPGLDNCTILFFSSDGSTVTDNQYATTWNSLPFTFSVSDSDYIVVFTAGKADNTNISPSDYNAQIEVGSTATAYEPYSAPEVKTISWESEAGTVYGGTLNVTTGELTVNYALIDLGALTWAYVAQNNRFYANAVNYNVSFPTNTSEIANIVAPIYKTISFNALTSDTSVDNCIAGVNTTSPFITIRDTRYNTVADFKAAMAGIYIASKINNPQVYQLTPEEVKTLLGVNNIYADTGDVDVTYRADIDLYIAKKIAEGA